MINGELRSKVDRIWDGFWSGGISNPLTVIEQITYLLFLKRLDDAELTVERKAARTGEEWESVFDRYIRIYKEEKQLTVAAPELRWSVFKNLTPQPMFENMIANVFPFLKAMADEGSAFAKAMKDAVFLIQKPSLLAESVALIDGINMDDADTKGDLYEYLLSKLATAGVNGQFRTPRHIIKLMVELIDPQKTDVICDPACGTAGFLVAAAEHILRANTSPAAVYTDEDGMLRDKGGDVLTPEEWIYLKSGLLHGRDFDTSMLRIAAMNLMLHGIDNPDIAYADSLSSNYEEQAKFTVVLANPPFKGSIDANDIDGSLKRVVNTKKTELLFLALMERILQLGGRCAVIVPDGVLFGSSTAHKRIREMLVEENQLEGIISMPSGVFKPYAGVSTAILLWTKGGRTDQIWFYDMQADGFSLDDKRTPIDANDIPDILQKWRNREQGDFNDRAAQAFLVPKAEIVANGYDLSINRYKQVVHEEVAYEEPKVILAKLRELEREITAELDELEKMVG